MKTILLSLICSSLFSSVALAHNGEDHGVTPAMVGQTLEPRFEARGNHAEVTGILSEGQLWLFASQIANSEPLPKLKIEVESAGKATSATEKSGGVYLVNSASIAQPGRHALTLTLQGDGVQELLTGTLVSTAQTASPKPAYGWIAAGLAALAALVWLSRRFSQRA